MPCCALGWDLAPLCLLAVPPSYLCLDLLHRFLVSDLAAAQYYYLESARFLGHLVLKAAADLYFCTEMPFALESCAVVRLCIAMPQTCSSALDDAIASFAWAPYVESLALCRDSVQARKILKRALLKALSTAPIRPRLGCSAPI